MTSSYTHSIPPPRFTILTTDGLVEAIGGLTVLDQSRHISENSSEVAYMNELFSHLSKPGKLITYAGVYVHLPSLRDDTIPTHAVHLKEAD